METAGKIKNDNMSNQDFYKFQFAAISRRGGVTPPYEQIGSIVVGAVSLSGMASSMRNTSLLISPIVQTTLYLPPFSCTVVRWTRRGGSSCVSASRRARPLQAFCPFNGACRKSAVGKISKFRKKEKS